MAGERQNPSPEPQPQNSEKQPIPLFRPMKPKETEKIPKNLKDWICEVKWNGMRVIIYIERNGDVMINTWKKERGQEKITDVTQKFPEIVRGLSPLSRKHSLVLDGEIVSGLGKSRENLSDVTRRLESGKEHVEKLVQSNPCQLIAFDILYRDGEDLTQNSLRERKKILRRTIPSSLKPKGIYSSDTRIKNRADIMALHESGYEGVVFKRPESKYYQGSQSYVWLKYVFKNHPLQNP